MKFVKHTVLLLSLLINNLLFAQWEPMVTPSIYHLYAIEAVTDDLVYAGGYGGSFVKTTDGGENWESIDLGIDHWVNSIHFFNAEYGWITCQSGGPGNSHIMKTTDGGASWTFMHSEDNYSCMYWLNDNTVFVGSWSGKIYKSSDAGENWIEIITPGTSNITHVQFFDDLNGMALNTDSYLMKTHDGGLTWNMFYHGGMYGFQFLTPEKGFCVDAYGRIGKTLDGGETYTYYETPFTGYKLQEVYFLNEYHGYVIGGLDCSGEGCVPKPAILSTNNGGDTWTNQIDHSGMLESIGFYDISVSPNGIPYLAGAHKTVVKNEIFASANEENQSRLQIYPNPNKGVFQINLPSENGIVEIYNSIGEQVYFSATNQNQPLMIDLKNKSAGLYHVQLKNEDLMLIESRRIIVQ